MRNPHSFIRFWTFIFLVSGALWVHPSQAYFEYRENADLKEELSTEHDRLLPQGDYYSLAVDTEFFKPYFGLNNPYYNNDINHGAGYWIDMRSELRLHDQFKLNTKIAFTEGTSSFGLVEKSSILPFFGASYRYQLSEKQKVDFRVIDLGRVTVGTGLFIEQKETNGGILNYQFGDYQLVAFVDATGSFRVDGGLYTLTLEQAEQHYGAYAIVQEQYGLQFPDPIISLFTKNKMKMNVDSDFEAGGEFAFSGTAGSESAMAYFQYQDNWGAFNFSLKPQIRYYGKGILGSLPGRVEQGYVSYEQNDKPYTTLMNIFTIDDHVLVGALATKASYQFSPFYSAFVDTELVGAQYFDVKKYFYPFYRVGLEFNLLKSGQSKIGFVVSNKWLTTTATRYDFNGTPYQTMTTPTQNEVENKPLFLNIPHVQIYLTARF